MTDKPINPQAFPYYKDIGNFSSGMTLRDYFAAAALMGIRSGFDVNMKLSAEEAYVAADAVLLARMPQPVTEQNQGVAGNSDEMSQVVTGGE